MKTVLELINLSTGYLESKGIESPRLNAELLLADILNCKRLDLYLAFDKPLKPEEMDKYREHIRQRGQSVPLQYVTGYVEFYGLRFSVDKNVLIPRPETENLVEQTLAGCNGMKSLKCWDVGTGSGVIAISLATHLPEALVTATDISNEALAVAIKNAEAHAVAGRIDFREEDIFTSAQGAAAEFDLIVSNPPYVEKAEYDTLQKEITVHEPPNAVTDYGDGYRYHRTLAKIAGLRLLPGGKIFIEVAKGQAETVADFLEKEGIRNTSIIKDDAGIDRIVTGERL